MRILKATDTVAIKNSGNIFTAAQIMEYCSNLGFTSFMLFAEVNSSYYILPCNPTKSNDNIYLFYDDSIKVNGFYSTASASSAYHNKFVYSPSAGTLSDSNETPNMGYTYAQTTWGRRYYYDGSGSRPEGCFYTTLSYTKIYLNNNEDITPAPSYNWESVASIVGKDKTYRLTDILNINEGSPMNDVQYDGNLDFSAKSKVNNMISEVVIDENAVAVEYKVPADNYAYTKLVYKRNSIPDDVDDGIAINIDPALSKVSIHNISSGAVYWFVIFTDKSTSEPYKFGTEENADELVLYDNGWVNSEYFDTDAEVIGQTQSEPISYNYEVKSNHLLIEYDNWRDTIYWRGVQVLFNKKTFPVCYTKIKLDLELYVKYNSQWDNMYVASPFSSVHGLLLKDFKNGENVTYDTYTDSGVTYERYVIGHTNGGSPTPYEATDRWTTEAVSLLSGNGTYPDYVDLILEGVNQYHKASMKVYKITLVKGGENIIPQNANLDTWDMQYPEAFENTFNGKTNYLTLHTLYNLNEPLTINVNARAGYKYTFLCKICSPTGFNRGLNYGEILNPSSSSESARIKIDNSASEEMKTYGVEYDCETSGQVTFGFDFAPITDYETIRFEISDLMILESKI